MRALGEAMVPTGTVAPRTRTSAASRHPAGIASPQSVARPHSERRSRHAGEPIPMLAQLVATSPLEAALFDAFGKALKANAYDLLHADVISQDLSHWLGADFRGEYLDQYTRRHSPESHAAVPSWSVPWIP